MKDQISCLGMKIGLIGLPSVGKTTLFNLLTGSDIEVTGFSQGKVQANQGIARIPDERLDYLAGIYKPKKTTYATIEVIDVPGLVRGSSQGKGVGNQFLDNIRKVDVLVHVLRVFRNENVIPEAGTIDPMRDIETVNLELLFADLGVIENRQERIKAAKKITKENIRELEVLEKCRQGLENGILLHNLDLSEEENEVLKTFAFLSEKPMIYAANLDEGQFMRQEYSARDDLLEFTQKTGAPLIELCIKTELDINELEAEERKFFLEELGITEPGIAKLSKTAYEHLGLISFLTVGPDEVRAWPVKKGTPARKAAGKIHSDIEKGFIRAEVCRFRDFKEFGSMNKAREKGLVTLEGKEYEVQDGDIINFRFNV